CPQRAHLGAARGERGVEHLESRLETGPGVVDEVRVDDAPTVLAGGAHDGVARVEQVVARKALEVEVVMGGVPDDGAALLAGVANAVLVELLVGRQRNARLAVGLDLELAGAGVPGESAKPQIV